MARILPLIAILGLVLLPSTRATAQTEEKADDPILRAMTDEMARSVEHLHMEEVEKPYYVEYTILEGVSVEIAASFGALETSSVEKERFLIPDVRVGDYTFDNTNFMELGGMGGFMGMGGLGGPRIVLDDDYDAVRHAIWLATDAAYKGAAEALATKQGLLKTLSVKDLPDDLSKEEPFVLLADPYGGKLDRKVWERRVALLSGIFREYPAIQRGTATFSSMAGTRRFVNSEGFRHRYGDSIFSLVLRASAQAEDGMEVSHGLSFRFKRVEDFPDEEEMVAKTKELAETVTEMAAAALGEEYTGPVLFEGGAAAGLFVQLLLNNIVDARKPLSDAGPMLDMVLQGAKLSEKVGREVMADSLDVEDDPTLAEFDGHPLVGGYPVDDDGVKPRKIQLVEAGKLLTLPMSRVPTREVTGSNGHARGAIASMDLSPFGVDQKIVSPTPPVANPSNVIIRAREGKSEEDLKKELLSRCEDEGLEYGIIVRSLRSPGGIREIFSSLFGGGGQRRGNLSDPNLVCKVYVEDGREEIVRGLCFGDVQLRAMREIVAAGEKPAVNNISYGGRMGVASLPVSVVVPSVLVEEVDIREVPPQTEKRPYLPRPH